MVASPGEGIELGVWNSTDMSWVYAVSEVLKRRRRYHDMLVWKLINVSLKLA
jgi:hypothetical protein